MKWRQVKGYPNYKINKNGKVLALNWKCKNIEKEIIPWKQKNKGYLMVNLWENGKQKKLLLHRLVAHNFIGDPSGMIVDHIDRNVENNNVKNLRIINIFESNQNRNAHPMRNITKHRNL